jgi:glutathione synthase
MLPLEAARAGFLKQVDLIPTLISQDRTAILKFVKQIKTDEIILKPFYGFAGHEIRKIGREHFLAAPGEYLADHHDLMIQPFVPEVRTEGDQRIFVLGGKYKGNFVRLPQGNSIISNLARGGRAELRPLTAPQKRVIKRVEKYIKFLGIDFAGVDLIGTKVGEINITSPTGLGVYERMSGVNLAKNLVDLYLRKARKK